MNKWVCTLTITPESSESTTEVFNSRDIFGTSVPLAKGLKVLLKKDSITTWTGNSKVPLSLVYLFLALPTCYKEQWLLNDTVLLAMKERR